MITPLVVSFTSSYCSMSFSMIMALLMGEFTGEEVLTQCLTLGPYLLGLGLGSVYGDRVPPDARIRRLFGVEWLSVIFLPLVPLLQLISVFVFLNTADVGFNFESREALTVLLTLTGLLSFVSGLLGGAQLPLILKSSEKLAPELVLAVNYLGPLFAGLSIAGLSGMAFSFGVQIYLIGLVQIAGLVFLVARLEKRLPALVSIFVPLAILYGAGHVYPELERLTVKSAYMNTRVNSWKDFFNPAPLLNVIRKYGTLLRVRTSYQTIDLFVEPGESSLGVPGNATLYLNRKPQFDIYSTDLYHQTMVDGSFNLLGRTPERILILGAGDGILLKELRRFPEVKEITMVELDQKMIDWSSENSVLTSLNEGSLMNPPAGAKILVMDAVTFLRTGRETFDLILVDFPFPNGNDLAKLYSVEFYQLVRRSLVPDGIVMIDLPLYLEPNGILARESRTILKTLHHAGFTNRLLIGAHASFVAAKPGGEKLRFRYDQFRDDLTLPAAFNLVAPFPEPHFTDRDVVNSMFRTRGL